MVWGMWGPYHCSRFEAFRKLAEHEGHQAVGVSLFSGSSAYQWGAGRLPQSVVHFDLGRDETKFPFTRISRLLAVPWKLRPAVALLPAYDHWSVALNAATRLVGGRVVMMNESHAGTARARRFKASLKRLIVANFHAGFVGGKPQRRYFASLGLSAGKIYTGYDAIDNEYFSHRTLEIKNQAPDFRARYQLPEHYFLSLGRFVAKKNLPTLLQAYRKFLDASRLKRTHLVMVGYGEEETNLRSLCAQLKLQIQDHKPSEPANTATSAPQTPQVHFYGFRPIDENPVFYALADAFILPSLYEEWGLVVNEAMACGLPVIVSNTLGCVEDLLAPERLTVPTGLPDSVCSCLTQLGADTRENGFLFDPGSTQSLANALTVLEAAPEIGDNMGKASLRIIGQFSLENFAANALLAAKAALGTTDPLQFKPAAANRL